jgi:hypothetical protein
MAAPLRVVQWTTGNVAREAVPAVLARPDLELVGVFAHSQGKVGRDVAELVGLPEPIGILATDDVGALLALEPGCVVHTPLHPDVGHLTTLLGAGVDVVTTAEFLTGRRVLGEDARRAIEDAAVAGGASIFGSGMHPGFAQLLTAAAAGISDRVHHVRLSESVDVSLFAGDANFDAIGWGRPAGDPGHPAAVEAATLVFAEGLDVLAQLVGVEPDTTRCTTSFAHATKDLDLPGRPVAAGAVAGIDVRWEAVVDGEPVLELQSRWVLSGELDPPMPVEHGYVVEVAGDPRIRLKLDIWPAGDLGSLTAADLHRIGMRMTALAVVNAIPYVRDAEPGIVTYADLPVVSTRLGRRHTTKEMP